MGSLEQTKTGNLIIEGVLRLGQFTTANAPSGTEGALYFDTTDNTTKLYSSAAWADLAGGWDGILPNYTTVQRNALSLADGLIVYNTTENAVQIYVSGVWQNVGAKGADGSICSSDAACDSTNCVDGYCCNNICTGNCNRCNVAGSEGICTDTNSDCTGNCDICSSGNCASNVALCTGNCDTCSGSGTAYSCAAVEATCTGNCDTCSGSGTAYSCAASAGLCTGDCDICSGSGTAYSCAASNALCANSPASCACSGSGTVFNCSSCPDTYGLCGYPTCSSYTCGNVPESGAACATCKTCSSGTCSAFVPNGSTGLNCTALHYRCDGSGGCTAPQCNFCPQCTAGVSCESKCSAGGYLSCVGGFQRVSFTCAQGVAQYNCTYTNYDTSFSCVCKGYCY